MAVYAEPALLVCGLVVPRAVSEQRVARDNVVHGGYHIRPWRQVAVRARTAQLTVAGEALVADARSGGGVGAREERLGEVSSPRCEAPECRAEHRTARDPAGARCGRHALRGRRGRRCCGRGGAVGRAGLASLHARRLRGAGRCLAACHATRGRRATVGPRRRS